MSKPPHRKPSLRHLIETATVQDELFMFGWAKSPDAAFIGIEIGECPMLIIDGEHGDGSMTPSVVQECIAWAHRTDTLIIPRIPRFDSECIRRYLGSGADGIMVPQIRTLEQAEFSINQAKYRVKPEMVDTYGVSCAFPEGARGVAGEICNQFGHDKKYIPLANDFTHVVVQIETAEAVDIVDKLVELDGISALFLGPADLSFALDIPGQFDNAVFLDAVRKVIAAATKKKIPVLTQGIGMRAAELRALRELGYSGAAYLDDRGAIINAAADLPKQITNADA